MEYLSSHTVPHFASSAFPPHAELSTFSKW